MNREMGIRQEILRADNEQEIAVLLEEGKTFTYAASRTRHSWESAAQRRRIELAQNAKAAEAGKIQTRQHPGS